MNAFPTLVQNDAQFRVFREQLTHCVSAATSSGSAGNFRPTCELCGERDSTVYCPSDRAHFCEACDARHHGSSKLLLRHFRLPVHHSPLQFGRCPLHHSEFVEHLDRSNFRLLCRVCLETGTSEAGAVAVISTIDALKLSASSGPVDTRQPSGTVWEGLAQQLRQRVHARHRKLLEIKAQLESVTGRIRSLQTDCMHKIRMHHGNKSEILTAAKKQTLLKLLTVEIAETWRVHYRLCAAPGNFLRLEHVFRSNKNFFISDNHDGPVVPACRPPWLAAKLQISGTLVISDQPISFPASLAPKAETPLMLEPLPVGNLPKISENLVVAKTARVSRSALPPRKAADFSDSIDKAEAAVAEVSAWMHGRPNATQGVSGNFSTEPGSAAETLAEVLKTGAFPFANALEILRSAKQSDRHMLIREMLEIFSINDKRNFLTSLVEQEVGNVQTSLLLNSAPSLVVSVVNVLSDDPRIGNLVERAAVLLIGREVTTDVEGLIAARRLTDGLLQQKNTEKADTELFKFLKTLLFACQKTFGSFTVGLNVCTGLFISRVLTPVFVKRCNGPAEISKMLLRISRGEEAGDDDIRELFMRIRDWIHDAIDEVPEASALFSIPNGSGKLSSFGRKLQDYISKYKMIDQV